MASGDIKIFTIVENGVTLKVTAIDLGGGNTSFTINCLSGSADINALYLADEYLDGTSYSIFSETGLKSDNSLNMNGTSVDWDAGVKLSSAGLGSEGTSKLTYLTAGEEYPTFTKYYSWDDVDIVGIRATSVGTSFTSIKGVASTAETISFPQVLTGDVQVTEGTDATAQVNITLANGLYPYPITVRYTVSDPADTAGNPGDYTTAALTYSVTFAPGETSKSVSIPIVNNNVVEGNEFFTVKLTSAEPEVPGPNPIISLAGINATVAVVDDDVLTFSIKETSDSVSPTVSEVTEGNAASYTIDTDKVLGTGITASVDVGITAAGGAGQASLADFDTVLALNAFIAARLAAAAPVTGVTVSGTTLTFHDDYVPGSGFIFTLPTFNDLLIEGNETYTVDLLNATKVNSSQTPVVSGAFGTVTTTIVDNDFAPVNQAPTNLHFVPVPQQGNDLTLGSFLATDPNGDTLTYTGALTGVSGTIGATINSSTGALTLSGAGQATLTVTASDGSLSTQKSYTVWVGANNVNDNVTFALSANDVIADGRGQNDTITGSSGPDFLFGGSVNDILVSGGGADWHSGGGGDDTFRFLLTSDSAPGAHDFIADWVTANDTIDLSAIDANTATPLPTNEAFLYGGQTNVLAANSVIWFQSGGNTFVHADNDGNTANGPELVIELQGLHTLTSLDFIL